MAAKRAQEAQQAELRRQGKAPEQQGAAFGGIEMGDDDIDLSKLPKGFGGF